MGVEFDLINSYKEFGDSAISPESPKQVFQLAEKVLLPIIEQYNGNNISHFIVATTCPDSLAPSVGQSLADKYNDSIGSCQLIDLVQGCAGGVSSMILASQLAEVHNSSVLVINSDAAKKATSSSSNLFKIFGNGAFGCIVQGTDSNKRLIHSKTRQFKGLSDVVTVKLGHDSDQIIAKYPNIKSDPRKYLGLSMNNVMALKLMRMAETFYLDFIKESMSPDILILHQVNPDIIKLLEKVFKKYKLKFINVASEVGNCGTATTGIALDMHTDEIKDKKVMICSYGTGGVITAGMWQF